jgi:hypothetical protein
VERERNSYSVPTRSEFPTALCYAITILQTATVRALNQSSLQVMRCDLDSGQIVF